MSHFNYFSEIEEHFVRRRGSPLLVSPLDWSLMATWRDAGVPLHIVIRGIDIAMEGWHSKKRRPTEKLSTLFYCHDAVMAEHERFLESRLGESPESRAAGTSPAALDAAQPNDAGPDKNALIHFLDERMSEIRRLRDKQFPMQEVRETLERVDSRLIEIRLDLVGGIAPDVEALERDLGVLDDLLVSSLSDVVPAQMREEWEAEAKVELKTYRKRLPKETYRKIVVNYLKSRVRRHFEVGELSLFQL